MRRTQIYLPEEMYKQIKSRAKRQGLSMAKLMRQLLNQELNKNQRPYATGNDLLKLAEDFQISGGPKDLSQRMNYYLYDEPYN